MCPDHGLNPQPFGVRDDAPPNWAASARARIWPLFYTFPAAFPLSSLTSLLVSTLARYSLYSTTAAVVKSFLKLKTSVPYSKSAMTPYFTWRKSFTMDFYSRGLTLGTKALCDLRTFLNHTLASSFQLWWPCSVPQCCSLNIPDILLPQGLCLSFCLESSLCIVLAHILTVFSLCSSLTFSLRPALLPHLTHFLPPHQQS